MIISRLNGGLGNQMFQYAIGRRISYEKMVSFKLDLMQLNHSDQNYGLDTFTIKAEIATGEDVRVGKKNIVTERKEDWFKYNSAYLNCQTDSYLSGYFQAEQYFSSMKNILQKDFSLKNFNNQKSKIILEEILKKNSISMHIRHYLKYGILDTAYSECTFEYYQNAANIIANNVLDAHFFIFTNDITFTRANFKLTFPFTIVDINSIKNKCLHLTDKNAVDDFYLMRSCKHNIIANSSFSWWAAWLNDYRNKIVIAPKSWMQTPKNSADDLIPAQWERV